MSDWYSEGIHEPFAITDDLVTEVGRITEIAPNLYRVILIAREPCVYNGTMERVAKCKLIMTGEAMRDMGLALAAGTDGERPEFHRLPADATAN